MKNLTWRVLRKSYHLAKFVVLNMRSIYFISKVRCKKRHPGKIRVGFIVQMAEIWDKQEPVYREMSLRDDMEVVMLVVPPYDFKNKKLTMDYQDNYFLNTYLEAREAIHPDGKVVNVEDFNLDYVFFPRPYDIYLPKALRSTTLVKKMKCCYIPYGFTETDAFNELASDPSFFRNIYVSFMDFGYMCDILCAKYRRTVKAGLRHFENLGYPSLEPYLKMRGEGMPQTLMWTPRWTYDEKLGGSHFLEFKDCFLALKKEFSELGLIFRPHPLMFDELVSKGRMTQMEIEHFLSVLDEMGIVYDVGKPIGEAIKKADILLTDSSSIMIMFFLTGKPIIYCKSQIIFNNFTNRMVECMYHVETDSEIMGYVAQLVSGKDPLAQDRIGWIESEFADYSGAAERIVDWIVDDSKMQKDER